MGTLVGVGYSLDRNPREAGKEAVAKALAQMGDEKPEMVFVFATVGYNQETLIGAIREASSGARLSGCSGEGIITGGMAAETNFGVCVMTIASDELSFHNMAVTDLKEGSGPAGEHLAEEVRPFLKGDTVACFLFADGFLFDFDPFQKAFESSLGGGGPVFLFGGLAADNWYTRTTYQYHNDQVYSGGISAVVVSGFGLVASGISHGCVPIGTRHVVTRSEGNVIHEIDGVPALDFLKEYVEEEDWHEQWNKVSLNLCLGFPTPDPLRKEYGDYMVRYMVAKDDATGSVTIQSDVAEGTEFWVVRRDKELIREGLQAISRQIHEKAGERKPKMVMHFECMGRGRVVFREQERNELIRSLQEQVGEGIPWIGFYTYGEIGPVSGYNCIHNFTAVVTAIF